MGQHVEYGKPPVKVIKITKTVAVKVPVPYPVKVIQKVPYPVHVAKPYPVPVTQIVKVPHGYKEDHEDGLHNVNDHGISGGEGHYYGLEASKHNDRQDEHSFEGHDNSQAHGSPGSQSEFTSGSDHADGHLTTSYNSPGNSYGYGHGDDGAGKVSFDTEANSYDNAINEYLKSHGSGGSNNVGSHHLSHLGSSNNENSHYH